MRRLGLLLTLLCVTVATSADERVSDPIAACGRYIDQQLDCVIAAIAAGADVSTRSAVGSTPLMWAAKHPDPAVSRTLLEAGADVNARDIAGGTALMTAGLSNENPAVIRTLLESGADIGARSQHGWTALMFAARHNGNPAVVEALLEGGADSSARNNDSKTAFDLMQDNEVLVGTDVYWRLNDLRFE